VNPGAVEALAEAGIEWRGRAPRSVDGLHRQRWDLVVTVCDDARESCPIFPAGPVVAHWGMPDPAAVEGDEARRAAFRQTLQVLTRRIRALAAQPVETLDYSALESAVRHIGGIA
jgi:protein-tyrosine-phosphatase